MSVLQQGIFGSCHVAATLNFSSAAAAAPPSVGRAAAKQRCQDKSMAHIPFSNRLPLKVEGKWGSTYFVSISTSYRHFQSCLALTLIFCTSPKHFSFPRTMGQSDLAALDRPDAPQLKVPKQ